MKHGPGMQGVLAGVGGLLAIVVLATAAIVGLPKIVSVSGYTPNHDPVAAVGFPGSSLVVVGTIEAHQPAREANKDHPMRMIYTPVRVRVTEVLKGNAQVGSIVIVRGIGGRVGDTVFEVEDIPSIRDLAVGERVLLFLADARDIGDGLIARTPEFVYSVDAQDVAHHRDTGVVAPLAEFKRLLAAAQ